MDTVPDITTLPKDRVVTLKNIKIAIITGAAVGVALVVVAKLKAGSYEGSELTD